MIVVIFVAAVPQQNKNNNNKNEKKACARARTVKWKNIKAKNNVRLWLNASYFYFNSGTKAHKMRPGAVAASLFMPVGNNKSTKKKTTPTAAI